MLTRFGRHGFPARGRKTVSFRSLTFASDEIHGDGVFVRCCCSAFRFSAFPHRPVAMPANYWRCRTRPDWRIRRTRRRRRRPPRIVILIHGQGPGGQTARARAAIGAPALAIARARHRGRVSAAAAAAASVLGRGWRRRGTKDEGRV